jgi:hypothetical protein
MLVEAARSGDAMTYLVEKTFRALRIVVGCKVVVWPSPHAVWIVCGNYISLAETFRDGIEGEPATAHLLREHEDGFVFVIREIANLICIYRLSGLLVRSGCAPERVPIRHSVIMPAS